MHQKHQWQLLGEGGRCACAAKWDNTLIGLSTPHIIPLALPVDASSHRCPLPFLGTYGSSSYYENY